VPSGAQGAANAFERSEESSKADNKMKKKKNIFGNKKNPRTKIYVNW